MEDRKKLKKMHKKLVLLEKKRKAREFKKIKDELAETYVLIGIAQEKIQKIFREVENDNSN